jgi:hypothetical protein
LEALISAIYYYKNTPESNPAVQDGHEAEMEQQEHALKELHLFKIQG